MADKVSKFIFPVKTGNTVNNKEFELPGGSSFDGDYNSLTNKPTLGTASAKDAPSSGNASSSQVVMGNDSRLSDSRNAKDVQAWAKASTKPTYTASEVGLGNVGNFKAVSTEASQGLTNTEKSNARANIGAGTSSLALGETSSTAYRGDRGKTAYDHSQSTHARTDATKTEASSTNGNIKINGTETKVYTHPGSGTNPHGTTKSDVGLGNVGNFKAVSTVASQGLSDTEKANARANIGAGTSSSDTKNTAGSTDTSSKLFLIGATSQAANPQTYSQDTAYVGTDGCLYSGSKKVLTDHQDISGKANLASPTFTGVPKAPTASAGTNTTQIATTAFVKNAVDNAQQMIAPIQTTLVALKAYAVGEQFVYNGLLYEVTAAIASGGTITINANCKLADTVTNQILLLISELNKLKNATRRTRRNITTDLANLPTAVAEQNLEKYGYTIGDYFIGNSGYTYILGDLNTFRGEQNNYAVINQNHISIVVKTGANSKWNETNDTSTGYSRSVLHSYLSGTVLNNIKSDMIALFGGSTGLEHLLSHKLLWTTAVSSWEWSAAAQYISALTEPQVYGTTLWSIDGYQTGEAWKHLELFKKFSFMEILGWIWFWLRSIQSASVACYATNAGYATHASASASAGVVGLIQFK